LGFIGAGWLFHRYALAGRSLLPSAKIEDFMIALVLGVMLGGRLGSFLLYHPEDLWKNPLIFFRVWEGGMASHGGFVGVTIACIIFARLQKIPFFHLADLIASASSLGLLLGRIANFINGELWGKVATVPWAVIFPQSPEPHEPRHPSQLYEAGLEGALLLAYMQWRFWRSDIVRVQPGRLCGEFLIGYAIVRAIGERFREPDADLIGGLSRGTFYSIFLLIAGIVLIVSPKRALLTAQPPSKP
jgi:phosphatidylglycerol:prolipoprotein diacylglycerol transferase